MSNAEKQPSEWIDAYRDQIVTAKDMSQAGNRGVDNTTARRKSAEMLHVAVECLLKAAHSKSSDHYGSPRNFGHDTPRLAKELGVDSEYRDTIVSLQRFYGSTYPGNPSPDPSNLEQYFDDVKGLHNWVSQRYF